MPETREKRPPFEVFRGNGAPTMLEHGCMTFEDMTPLMTQGLSGMADAGSAEGSLVDVPYSRPEMSLARLRLKSGYPLPLHTHNCDCLYYVASGSLTIGTETLGAGDGFFVGADVPYGYVAGPEGAVVLEFRATEHFNVRFQVNTEKGWNRLARQVGEAKEHWAEEALPAIG